MRQAIFIGEIEADVVRRRCAPSLLYGMKTWQFFDLKAACCSGVIMEEESVMACGGEKHENSVSPRRKAGAAHVADWRKFLSAQEQYAVRDVRV